MSRALASDSLAWALGGTASLASDYGWALVVAVLLCVALWVVAARSVRGRRAGFAERGLGRRTLALWLGAWLAVSVAGAWVVTRVLRSVPVDVRLDLEAPIEGAPELVFLDGSGETTGAAPMAALGPRFGIPQKPFISIRATGRRSVGSGGSQVWVGEFPAQGRLTQDPPDTWKTNARGGTGTLAAAPTTLRWEGAFGRNLHLEIQKLPWAGIAEIGTADGTRTVDLYAERVESLSVEIPPASRTTAYWVQVPRGVLGAVALRFPEGAQPKVVRLYEATLIPTILTPLAASPETDWGRISTNWEAEPKGGFLAVPPIAAVERGGRATFLLMLGLFLVGSGVALAATRLAVRVAVVCWRAPLPELRLAPWRWWRLGALFLPAMLYWGVWLLAFYPGCVCPDSLDQWNQAKTGVYWDHHPATLAIGITVLTKIWDSPAIVTLMQMLILALALAFAADFLWRAGVRRWVVVLAYLVTLLSPKTSNLVVVLLKDVPYAGGTLVVCVLLAYLLVSPAWRGRVWSWVALGLTVGACRLVRHNGSALIAATLLMALWVFRGQWRRVAVAAACAVVLVVGVRSGLYRVVGVRVSPHPDVLISCILSRIAPVVDQYPALAPGELAKIDAARPIDDAWAYCPAWMCSIFYYRAPLALQPGHVRDHLGEYERLLGSLAIRYPAVLWRHTVRSQDYLFWPLAVQSQPIEAVTGETPATMPLAREWGLKTEPVLPATHRWVVATLWHWTTPAWSWLVWRPALSVYACLIGLVVLVWRTREARFAIVYVAPLIVLPTLLATFTQCVRYVLPVTFAAPFLVGLAWVPWRGGGGAGASPVCDEMARCGNGTGEGVEMGEGETGGTPVLLSDGDCSGR